MPFNFPIQCGHWAGSQQWSNNNTPRPNNTQSTVDDWDYDIPSHLQVVRCAEWIDMPTRDGPDHVASCLFTLPLASDTLLFLARGPFSHGSVGISQAEVQEERNVKVQIIATFRDRGRFNQNLKVCQVKGTEGEGEDNGVGIFTRRNELPISENIHLNLHVFIVFPKNSIGEDLVYLPNLHADMRLFSYNVADLASTLVFESVSLRTENMPVHAKSLFAHSIDVYTVNSPIIGNFCVTSSLGLLTSNSPINTTISLMNDQDDDWTEAILHTSNAPITASMNLTTVQETGGTFKIDADTSLSSLDISFLSAPVDSTLHLKARTAMGSCKVDLHPTYQGTFDISTTMGSLHVIPKSETEPVVRRRSRKVEVDERTAWRARGCAYWGQQRDMQPQGTVQAHTVMGPAELVI